jgi:D-alanyl-D-alanine carboxypeptidase
MKRKKQEKQLLTLISAKGICVFMNQKKNIKRLPIAISLLILLILIFTFVNAVTFPVSAPSSYDDGADSAGGEQDAASDIPETTSGSGAGNISDAPSDAGIPGAPSAVQDSGAADALETENAASITGDDDNPPDMPAIIEYITIHIGLSDICKGSLILVNHEYSYELPESSDFVVVSNVKTTSYRLADSGFLLSETIINPLNEMMDAFFAETGSSAITIRSAFRDLAWQQQIYNSYVSRVGQLNAGKWASLPGHSEHHTGLAFDFGVYSDGEVRGFSNTGVNTWFVNNSYRYGFILRYPAEKTDITGTTYEPWHFRYVGIPHAYYISENGLCLEEYIELLTEFTQDEPLSILYDDNIYEVFFTRSVDIGIPADSEYDISGNNIDGFIVTLKLL